MKVLKLTIFLIISFVENNYCAEVEIPALVDDNQEQEPSCGQKLKKICAQACDPIAIVKAVTYRVFAVFGTAGISYFVTGNPSQSLQIAGYSAGVSTFLYYTYDRFWKCASGIIPRCRDKCRRNK